MPLIILSASMDSDAAADASTKASAQEALACLPKDGVAFACAYGSRYLENAKASQLDLLIAVENSQLDAWHYQNLRQNPKHYFLSTVPPLAYGLAKSVRAYKPPNKLILCRTDVRLRFPLFSQLQRRPPGAFFHTFVEHPTFAEKIASGQTQEEIGSQFWKYGVIGVDQLEEDLTTWNHLFVAGRLHKPILKLDTGYFTHQSVDLEEARSSNLRAAIAAALVQMPQNFSELDLYYVISSLSYAGDIRLLLRAENPQKLSNMIYNRPHAVKRFREHFRESLAEFESEGLVHRARKPSSLGAPGDVPIYKFEQDPSKKPDLVNKYFPVKMRDDIYAHSKAAEYLATNTHKYVFNTVRRSSSKQFVNNLLMNNPLKSAKYATAKLAKGLLRR